MAQRDRFQQQRGAGSGFVSSDRDRSASGRGHEGKLSPDERNHPMNRRRSSFEQGQRAITTALIPINAAHMQYFKGRVEEGIRRQKILTPTKW
jgi:hypothetical protein